MARAEEAGLIEDGCILPTRRGLVKRQIKEKSKVKRQKSKVKSANRPTCAADARPFAAGTMSISAHFASGKLLTFAFYLLPFDLPFDQPSGTAARPELLSNMRRRILYLPIPHRLVSGSRRCR
jgi:hypothetical protein